MKKIATIGAAIVFATAVVLGQGGASPEVQLKAAIHKEQVEGDLQGAAEQFKKLAQSPNRTVAAQAWVRLGQCYEKIGDAQARQAYERAVRDFPEQTAVVAIAQARLLALTGNRPGVAYRQVWTGPRVDPDGRVSADGRLLSCVDWGTGDLALHDFETGSDRRLTNKGTWEQSDQMAEGSAISQDGKQVAYGWYDGKDSYELRVAAIPSSGFVQPRRLASGESFDWISPAHWSADGKWVAVNLLRKDRSYHVGVVSVQDGSLRMLAAGRGSGLFFSPDSKFLGASVGDPERFRREVDVFALAVDGSRQATVVNSPGRDEMMGWSPDGKTLLFVSDRTGSFALWGVPVADGKPHGPAVLLRPDIQPNSLGVTASGAMYIWTQVDGHDVHVAPLDFGTGRALSPPGRPIETYVGKNGQPDWSPDGKLLAYTSNRNPTGSDKVLAIRAMDGGQTRELHPDLRDFNWPRWAPDGASLVSQGTAKDGRQGVYLIDAKTGAVSPVVLKTTGGNLQRPTWSPDGKRIYYLSVLPNNAGNAIFERELASGVTREVIRRQGIMGVEVSPDGRYIATFSTGAGEGAATGPSSAALVIPIAGGEPRVLLRSTPAEPVQPVMAWGPPGTGVLIQTTRQSPYGAQLWLVPIDGGAPRKIDVALSNPATAIRVNPDGRQIAYVFGQNTFEVMVLENFLPKARAEAKPVK